MNSPGAEAVEDMVFLKLVRVVNLTARPFQQRVGRAHQLTLNEWRTMALLGSRPGLTATQLAELTGLDKMAVSRALAGLQRAKRLHRHEDPTDQRRSRLYLSSAGKAVHAAVALQAGEGAAHRHLVEPGEFGELGGAEAGAGAQQRHRAPLVERELVQATDALLERPRRQVDDPHQLEEDRVLHGRCAVVVVHSSSLRPALAICPAPTRDWASSTGA